MYIIDDKLSQTANNNFLKRCNSSVNKDSFDNLININNYYSNSFRTLNSRNKKLENIIQNTDNMINIYSSKTKLNLIRSNSLKNYDAQSIFFPNNQAKGTNLPIQYSRNKFYQIPSLFKNFQNNTNKNSNINLQKLSKDYKSQENNEKDNKSYIDINKIGIRERIYKPYLWDNVDKKELINQRDKLMPKGFQFYEKLVNKENKKYFENNYIIRKQPNKKLVPILIRDANKQHIEESDIFFQNKNIKKRDLLNKISRNKELAIQTFYSSDIFNKKINPSIIKKSGEISYFRKIEPKEDNKIENLKFNKNSETPKGWGVRESIPSLLNYSSINFNPLNPGIKNFCKTKDNIFNECTEKYKGHNPMKKQKSLSEFIDLTNVNASNYNNDYNKVLNKNPNAFKKNENMFTEYYKIFYNYNNISEKPFYKFIPSVDNNKSNNLCHNDFNKSNLNYNYNTKMLININESQSSRTSLYKNK